MNTLANSIWKSDKYNRCAFLEQPNALLTFQNLFNTRWIFQISEWFSRDRGIVVMQQYFKFVIAHLCSLPCKVNLF